MAEALRHLGIAAHAAGQLELARQRLEESTRLRREAGLLTGAAANMVGLAYIAAGPGPQTGRVGTARRGRRDRRSQPAIRILQQVDEARVALSGN